MTDTKSLNPLLLIVIISSKNDCSWNHDLSDLTVQVIFDTSWAAKNGGSQRPIALINCSYVSLCNSIDTAVLRRLAALASYVSFVIKSFAIHQIMSPAQWGSTSWQTLISQH
jgi:hypothetical protein